MQAFKACDVDGEIGLTWEEIQSCEDTFCALLNFECPEEKDFHECDKNNDGNLTLQEYMDCYLDAHSQSLF